MFRRRSSTATSTSGPASGATSPAPPGGEDDASKGLIGQFKAKYLGSVSVEQAVPKSGDDPLVPDAIKRCLQQKLKPRKVYLSVRTTEIVVADRESLEVIQTTPITELSFSGVDPRDAKRFLYITQNRSSLKSCHVFDVKFDAMELPDAIGKAFELFAVEMKRLKLIGSQGGGDGGGDGVDSAISDLVRAALEQRKKTKSSAPTIGKVFDAFFLGTKCVDKKFGEDVVVASWLQLKKERDLGKKGKDMRSAEDACSITITDESLTVFNRFTAETVFQEFIKTISFIFVVERFSSDEVVAYIAVDERLGRQNCFFYSLPSGDGSMMSGSMSEAFQKVFEREKARGNPFEVTDPKREPIEGILHSKQIHRAHLTAVKPIGAGQFGEVYLANQAAQGGGTVQRAVKMLRNSATDSDRDEFLREAEIHAELDHPNLVSQVGVAVQQRPWLAVLEYMPYGDVRSVLLGCHEKGLKLTVDEMLYLCLQLCTGMAFLASRRLVHMDLAARNCLLGVNNLAKISDFGLTRRLPAGKDEVVLTERLMLAIKWLALESIEKRVFSESSDAWAFGVVMWEIFSYGKIPYAGIKVVEVPAHVSSGGRLPQPDGCPSEIYTVMQRCWSRDRATRPAFADLSQVLMIHAPSTDVARRDIGKVVAEKH